VAMSPFSKPSSLETTRTASKSRSIEASLPMLSRWQNAAMQSSTIVERIVPGRDRTWNTRALSTEKAAPTDSNKKVPQTPRRQPATNPVVKPPITSPSARKRTPHIQQVNQRASQQPGSRESGASAETFLKIFPHCDRDGEIHAAGRLLSDSTEGVAENRAMPA